MTAFVCPLSGDPACRGYCTLAQVGGRTVIWDHDCFRQPVYSISKETHVDDDRP